MCISIVGANTGASAILKFDACFPDSVIGFIPFEGVSYVRFVKYSLELLRVKLKHISEGAARENLSMEKLLTVKINTPSIVIQRRIASVLSAYDDLIENNLRRIKLLEELAQRTYEEWFVRFRFPGHETAVFYAETVLPEGWERRKLGEILGFIFGKALKADKRDGGKFPVDGSSGIVGGHSKAIAKRPSVILGRKGNVGSVFWLDSDSIPIDTVHYVNSELKQVFYILSLEIDYFYK